MEVSAAFCKDQNIRGAGTTDVDFGAFRGYFSVF